jgi:Iap family predicted aminopeptidase
MDYTGGRNTLKLIQSTVRAIHEKRLREIHLMRIRLLAYQGRSVRL